MYYVNNPVPETDRPVTLWRGIDTIKIGIGIQWNDSTSLDTLESMQKQVREKPHQWLTELDKYTWAILPYGRKKYRYGLQRGQLSVFFSEEDYGTETPNAMVEAYPQAITMNTLPEIMATIKNALADLGGTPHWTKISELHLTGDIHVPQPLAITDVYDHNFQPKWISRARKIQAHTNHEAPQEIERLVSKSARLETMTYGGNQLLVRIYNKQAELAAHTDKAWERGLWNCPTAEHVTRVEFQIRREKLKLFGVNGTDTLEKQIPAIWAYLTQEWFTLCEHRNQSANRDAIISPFWETVQNAWTVATPQRPIPRPQENARQRLAQAFGNLISAAAILDKRGQEEIDELWNIWREDHPEEWYTLVAKRQEKIATLKGKMRIRDQGAEIIWSDLCAMTTPLLEEKNTKNPQKSPNAQLAQGMLLDIPASASAGPAVTDARMAGM